MEKILAIKQLHPRCHQGYSRKMKTYLTRLLNDTSLDKMIKGISDAAAITVRGHADWC